MADPEHADKPEDDRHRRRRAPLSELGGEKPPAPGWFADALSEPAETGRVNSSGVEIVWKAWGRRGAPGLICVHGGTAHKGWWDAIAPFLARAGYRVVAPDLAGMGESGWREAYDMPGHAADMRAAAHDAGAFEAGPPVMAGHSFGGFVTITAAMRFGAELAGAVLLDAPIRKQGERRADDAPPPRRGGKVYPDLAAALARFRLLPEQECDNLWLVDHIARGSLKQVRAEDGSPGWTWRFDPDLWAKLAYQRRDPETAAKEAGCPLAFIRGAQSVLMQAETWDFMRETFNGSVFMTIADAQHHLILDQPIATAAALEALLAAGFGRR